jgi:phage-related tail fiber protein
MNPAISRAPKSGWTQLVRTRGQSARPRSADTSGVPNVGSADHVGSAGAQDTASEKL